MIAAGLLASKQGKASSLFEGEGTEMRDERYRVQSLGRALDLLDRIAESGSEGARLTDLARGVGLSKAAAYAALATLIARGLVVDFGAGMTRRYRLGLSLLRLGDLAVSNIGLADIAMPILRDLTQELGMTSRVAVMDEGFAVVIGRVDAPGAIRFDAALGRREEPHCSGVGKVLLAAMPRANALELLERVGHEGHTTKTLTSIDALSADLDRIAARHYAIDDEEDHEGIVCVAAAVFGRDAKAVGAISITTLKQLLPAKALTATAGVLIRHSNRISLALGGPLADQAWRTRR
jgi:IclR family transcriptional regulator, acetate operon repressor